MLTSLLYVAFVLGFHAEDPLEESSGRSWLDEFTAVELVAARRALARLERYDKRAWQAFFDTHGEADPGMNKAELVAKARFILGDDRLR